MSKNEVIIIRDRGKKVVEVKIIPSSSKQGKTKFSTDNLIFGSMETKRLPAKFDNLITHLDANGKIKEVGDMIKYIFSKG